MMKTVKRTDEYTVYQKRSGRYAVKDKQGAIINEQDKVSILLAEGLIVAPEPKSVAAEVTEEAGSASEEGEVAAEAEKEEQLEETSDDN